MRALKLSEAIRIGSLKSRQAIGFYRRQTGVLFWKIRWACALGAARDAVHLTESGTGFRDLFPISWELIPCPVCAKVGLLAASIVHLNDDQRWTRERIADFVESVENAQSANAVTAQSVSDRSEEHQEENRELSYA